jgi:hypothetical protein
MGAGGSAAGKAYREWTADDVASGIEKMEPGWCKKIAAGVREEGTANGEALLNKERTLVSLLEGVDEVVWKGKEGRIDLLQNKLNTVRNPTETHWITLAKKGLWVEADALEEMQNKQSKVFPCSLATCKEHHANHTLSCDHRGYCSSECNLRLDGEMS